jgi:dUTP pyrophosphatase
MSNQIENEEEFNKQFDVELNKLLEEIEKLTFSPDDLDEDADTNEIEKNLTELDEYMNQELLKVELPFKKLHADALIPNYAYELDSGFDFYSIEEIQIPGFGRALVPTGLAFEVPDGTELQVRSKSGLAINQGLMVLNSPGTVDCGYLGEIKVIVMNMNNHPIRIEKFQKVAQGVLCPVFNGKKVKVSEKNNLGKSDRGENGFGSTGI